MEDFCVTEADAPEVSVVIPAFNAAATIEGAIASVRSQTLTNLEILVVDDGSTDDTFARVSALQAIDPRIVVLRSTINRGAANARNRALDAARGRWIALVDADDTIVPTRLHRLVKEAEARSADLMADNLYFDDFVEGQEWQAFPDGQLGASSPLTALDMISTDFPRRTTSSLGYLKPLMRRLFLEQNRLRYDEALRVSEDFNLYLRAAMEGAKFHCMDWPGYCYRRNAGSLTRSPETVERNYRDTIESNRRLQRFAQERNQLAVVRALRDQSSELRVAHWIDLLKSAVYGRKMADTTRTLLKVPPHPRILARMLLVRLLLGRQRNPMEPPVLTGGRARTREDAG